LRFLQDARAHFVPEGSGSFQRVHGNAQVTPASQIPRGKIGAVLHGFGHLQDASFGERTDSAMVVQGAVDRAGGNSEGISEIEESNFLVHGITHLKTPERDESRLKKARMCFVNVYGVI
jgi:hypothetical protein